MIALDIDMPVNCYLCPCFDIGGNGLSLPHCAELLVSDNDHAHISVREAHQGRSKWCPWIEVSNDRVL